MDSNLSPAWSPRSVSSVSPRRSTAKDRSPNIKWGFDKEYGHKHLPFRWHSSSGFHTYDAEPLRKKSSFHEENMPVYGDGFCTSTSYEERPQDPRFSMSAYGCHREMPWGDSLRSPRNPFPGLPNREQKYTHEQPPSLKWRSRDSLTVTAKSITSVRSPRSSSGIQTPLRQEHVDQLKTWLQDWKQTSSVCRQEHARVVAGLQPTSEI